jgi:hypothetical protein
MVAGEPAVAVEPAVPVPLIAAVGLPLLPAVDELDAAGVVVVDAGFAPDAPATADAALPPTAAVDDGLPAVGAPLMGVVAMPEVPSLPPQANATSDKATIKGSARKVFMRVLQRHARLHIATQVAPGATCSHG